MTEDVVKIGDVTISKERLKLFVWEDVLEDYSTGIVCVLAMNEEHAWDLIYKECSTAWWTLQDNPDFKLKTQNQDTAKDAYEHMKKKGAFITDKAVRPKIIKDARAFVVWGGG